MTTSRFSPRSIELARKLRAKALANLGRKRCKWCDREVEPRSSFGEDYWRHVDDRTAVCFARPGFHLAEPWTHDEEGNG